MYRQHFGITAAPLGKDHADLWDDGALTALNERFQWLLPTFRTQSQVNMI